MRIFRRVLLLALASLFFSGAASAQQCTAPSLPTPSQARLIDARPGQPRPVEGKAHFDRKGRIVITNMNPFLYDYAIKVEENEIDESDTVRKFAKLLAPVIGDFTESSQAESAGFARGAGIPAAAPPAEIYLQNLRPLLASMPTCTGDADATLAINHLNRMKQELLNRLQLVKGFLDAQEPISRNVRNEYIRYGKTIYDDTTKTPELCQSLNDLYPNLSGYATPDQIAAQLTRIEEIQAYINELSERIPKFKALYPNCNPKIEGYEYLDSLARLTVVVKDQLVDKYRRRLEALGTEAGTFSAMREAIEYLHGREEELLQKEFPVGGKFDYSRVQVSVTAIERQKDGGITRTRVRTPLSGSDTPASNTSSSPNPGTGTSSEPSTGNPSNGTSGGTDSRREFASGRREADEPTGGNAVSKDKQTSDQVIIGRPRFEISAGLVYSPLEKREFQVVTGFARDQQGNLTNGETFTQIVGFKENSNRRLLPMGMLHTRLTNFPNYNLYFSLGITAKRDNAGTDVEYLIGPSINLSDRIFLTVGGYAGKQQELAGDLFPGAALPEGVDNTPFRKRYRMKLGMAFSYRLPMTGGGGNKSSAAKREAEEEDDPPQVRDEVLIGQPRFVLSAGLAYTSLARREFQTVVGFERDRGGNLTNGETFTQIVGFKENARTRIIPMGMLSTRLTRFRDYNLYFSLGITAKRDDAGTDVEYLIGPSVSFFKNRLLFTAGSYAGRQQRLAGDIFINQKLPEGGSITTQKEYSFKPGFAFTYKIPVKLP